MFSHDLLIQNKNPALSSVDVTITTFLEDGTKPQIKRFWETWQADEVKKVNIPAGSLQTVEMSGKAYLNNRSGYVSCAWSANRTKGQP